MNAIQEEKKHFIYTTFTRLRKQRIINLELLVGFYKSKCKYDTHRSGSQLFSTASSGVEGLKTPVFILYDNVEFYYVGSPVESITLTVPVFTYWWR